MSCKGIQRIQEKKLSDRKNPIISHYADIAEQGFHCLSGDEGEGGSERRW